MKLLLLGSLGITISPVFTVIACGTETSELQKFLNEFTKLKIYSNREIIKTAPGQIFDETEMRAVGTIIGKWPSSPSGTTIKMTYEVDNIKFDGSGDIIITGELDGKKAQAKLLAFVVKQEDVQDVIIIGTSIAQLGVKAYDEVKTVLKPIDFSADVLVKMGELIGFFPKNLYDVEMDYVVNQDIKKGTIGYIDVFLHKGYALNIASIPVKVLSDDEKAVEKVETALNKIVVTSTKDISQSLDVKDLTEDVLKNLGTVTGEYPKDTTGITIKYAIIKGATQGTDGLMTVTIDKNGVTSAAFIVLKVQP